nr:MAG TPA: hypothetical protein [Caudoviricetes sp.]
MVSAGESPSEGNLYSNSNEQFFRVNTLRQSPGSSHLTSAGLVSRFPAEDCRP